MSEHALTYLGIEIGGSKLQIVEGDASASIVRRWRATAERERGAERIRRQLEDALRGEFARAGVAGVGVGFGGPADHVNGRTAVSHQVGGWNDFPLRDWLREVTGAAAVVVENDSNAAALGEAFADPDSSPLFYFNLGSGVGGGLAIDRQIYHGVPPGECEFGHLRLDRSGATVESRCSGWAVDARIRQRRNAVSAIAKLTAGMSGGEAAVLPEALRQGDQMAKEIVAELADDLGFALSHVVHLFHPKVIVMGGGLSMIGESLREPVERALPRYVMEAFLPAPAIRLARLGEDSVPVGALHLAIASAA